MLKSIYRYACERSPLPFVVTLSLVLLISGLNSTDVTLFLFFKGWLSMALFLFFIRLSDDICDIPIDRVTHPERLLCSGAVSLKHVKQCRVLVMILLPLLQLPDLTALLFVSLILAFFLFFFFVKPTLPVLVHTTLLNGSLFVYPVYAGILFYGSLEPIHFMMGFFFSLGGLAHDYSHCIIDTQDKAVESLNPINRINQRSLAIGSLGLFLSASLIGGSMLFNHWVNNGFALGLSIMTSVIIYWEIQLIRQPNETTAKPFYVGGFIFFLLPGLFNAIGVFLSWA